MKLVGTWWLPDEEVHLEEWIAQRGNYQTAHRNNALKHVERWGVCLDIGAHIGTWSREFAHRFARVHAFEPVAEHRRCFRANVIADNVSLYPLALGAEPGLVALHTEPHSTGGTHIDPGKPGNIPVLTLDSFEFDRVDFIKIDCEGYETFILKGGGVETLKRCKPVVCIEQKPHGYFGLPRYAARDFLVSLGMTELGRVHDDIVLGW